MNSDNIVDFPGTKGSEQDPGEEIVADDVLKSALGRYEDVVIIGIKGDGAQCISTLSLSRSIFELSRAIHKLHFIIDDMHEGT